MKPFILPKWIQYRKVLWSVKPEGRFQCLLASVGFNNQVKLRWGLEAVRLAIEEGEMEVVR